LVSDCAGSAAADATITAATSPDVNVECLQGLYDLQCSKCARHVGSDIQLPYEFISKQNSTNTSNAMQIMQWEETCQQDSEVQISKLAVECGEN
jgi:hypothetical protein